MPTEPLCQKPASISLGPGQAPATNFPEHVSAVLIQVPLPELVVQLAVTQHSTLSGSLGQYPATLKPEVVQSVVCWQVPEPYYSTILDILLQTATRDVERTGVLHVEPIARSKRREESAASRSVAGRVDTRPSEMQSTKKTASKYIVMNSTSHESMESKRKSGEWKSLHSILYAEQAALSKSRTEHDDRATSMLPEFIVVS